MKKNLLKGAFALSLVFIASTSFAKSNEITVYNKDGIKLSFLEENKELIPKLENNSLKDMFDVKLLSKNTSGLKIKNGSFINVGTLKRGDKKTLDKEKIKFEIEEKIKEKIKNGGLLKTGVSVNKFLIPVSIAGVFGVFFVLVKEKKCKKFMSIALATSLLATSLGLNVDAKEKYDHEINIKSDIKLDGKVYEYTGVLYYNDTEKEGKNENKEDKTEKENNDKKEDKKDNKKDDKKKDNDKKENNNKKEDKKDDKKKDENKKKDDNLNPNSNKKDDSKKEDKKEISKEDVKIAKDNLKKYLESVKEDFLNLKGIDSEENKEVLKQIKDLIVDAKNLLKDEDITKEKLSKMKDIPFRKVGKEKKGLLRKLSKKVKVDFKVESKDEVLNPHTNKKYPALKDNKIFIKTSLENLKKSNENADVFFKLNYVTKENFDKFNKEKVDALTSSTPRYERQEINTDDYTLTKKDNGYEVEIKKVPKNVKILKPVVYVKLSDGVYFENGTLVFVKEKVFDKNNISEISIKKNPTKMIYNEKEKFDPTGMVVTLKDKNGLTKDVEYKDFKENSIDVEKDILKTDTKDVVISLGNVKCKLNITVNALKNEKNLSIKEFYNLPKIEIEKGSTFDKEKLPKKVTLVLSDNSKVDVDVTWNVGYINTYRVGETEISGKYELPKNVTEKKNLTLKVIIKEKKSLEITSFEKINDFVCENGKSIKTSGDESVLPKSVKVTLSDNTKRDINVKKWNGEVNFWHKEETDKTFTLKAELDLEDGITSKIDITLNIIVKGKKTESKPSLSLDKESYFYNENPIITYKNFPFGRPTVIVKESDKDRELKQGIDYVYDGSTKTITLKTDSIFKKENKEFSKDEVLNIVVKRKDFSTNKESVAEISINYKKTPSLYSKEKNYEFDKEDVKVELIFDDSTIKDKIKFFNGENEIKISKITKEKDEYETEQYYFYISKDEITKYIKDNVNGIKIVGKLKDYKDFFFTIIKKDAEKKKLNIKAKENENEGSTPTQKIPFYTYGQNHSMKILVNKENGLTKEFLKDNLIVKIQSVEENEFYGKFTVSESEKNFIVSVPTVQESGKIIYKNLINGETKKGYDKRFPITNITLSLPGFLDETVKFSIQQ